MRIAQIAPLHESVPPRLYGGTERVVHFLTESLVAMGHEVTLFASGDSRTSARLIAPVERALRLTGSKETVAPHVLLLEVLLSRLDEFDIVHFHTDCWHLPIARRLRIPCLTTLHGRLDLPELAQLYWEFRDHPVISISDAQRSPLAWANWQATVHHGLPAGLLPFSPSPSGRPYLAFTGRISPEKRPDLAIEIARRVGLPLRIAAKVDDADRAYFEGRIRPLLSLPWVEYVGEVDEHQKAAFLGNARALLFPIDWPEPFGLVMIEAMSCGTPVVALRPAGSSVPEVIEHGRSGIIVPPPGIHSGHNGAPFDAPAAAARATHEALGLDRRGVRAAFERRFTSERMAEDYLRVYRRLAAPQRVSRPSAAPVAMNGSPLAGRFESGIDEPEPALRAAPAQRLDRGAAALLDPESGAEHGRSR